MTKQLFIAAMALISVLTAAAQKRSIENIYEITLQNSDAIKEGSEVKGYYFFYISDKIDRKNNEYTLQITDANLVKIKDIKFVSSRDLSILESSFNGTDLIFLFYNSRQRSFEYEVYGADGKKKFSYTKQLERNELAYIQSLYSLDNSEESQFKGLFPVEGKGFLSNMPTREDGDYTFQIDFFSTGKKQQWKYVPTEGAKRFIGDYLGYANGIVYIEVLKFGSTFDQSAESFLLGLSLETGKKVFEVPTDSKFRFYPASMAMLSDGSVHIYGEYFEKNANILKDKSQGFAFWSVDDKGKVVSEKYCSWSRDLAKHMKVSAKGKIEDFGYLYIHKVVRMNDGSIYTIGEGYKKAASTLGIISAVASAGHAGISTVKLRVTDLMLIKFDSEFNVKDADIFEKTPNNKELPSGYEFVSTPMLGKLLKFSHDGFDYAYTQTSDDFSSFTVCYSDYVKDKNYKGTTFNSITYTGGKLTKDRINTKSDATKSTVLPAKLGQVLILDYYKKEKRMDARFEKLN